MLQLKIGNVFYFDGESVPFEMVGNQASPENPRGSLICITDYVRSKCCRTKDEGNLGEWFFPNGTQVPRNNRAPPGSTVTRTGFTRQVRLNRKGIGGPYGVYTCRVPTPTSGKNISISINLSK